MKIDLTPTDVAYTMDALATRRQQIAQWIEDRMVDRNFEAGALDLAENKMNQIDKAWAKFNVADTDDMQKAKDKYLADMDDDLEKAMEEAEKAFRIEPINE